MRLRAALLGLIACACGPVDEGEIQVATVNQPPIAAMVAPADARVGEEVSIDARESTDVDGEITSVVVQFGDGSDAQTNLRAAHTYAAPGLYTIDVYVADDLGARGRARHRIVIDE